MAKVACLGILVADVVGKPIDALPPRGTLAAVDRIELHAGGCAANTAIALARLGVSTAVLGKVGRDGFGDFLAGILHKEGISTSGLLRDPDTATSATMVAVDADGERTFLHHAGANAEFTLADVAWPVIQAADVLHVAGPFLMPQFMSDLPTVLEKVKVLGKITSLDTVWDFTGRWMSVLEPCLPFLDYILPSLEEAKQITGCTDPREISEVFFAHGVGIVGLKMGAAGAYVRTAQGEEITVPALAVPVVDTLGAGDAWAGGFLCGILRGWDLERTARFANAVGALCVQSLGATQGLRSFEETCALAGVL